MGGNLNVQNQINSKFFSKEISTILQRAAEQERPCRGGKCTGQLSILEEVTHSLQVSFFLLSHGALGGGDMEISRTERSLLPQNL